MTNFKVGDFVYYSLTNSDKPPIFQQSGLIINIVNDNISVLCGCHGSSFIYNLHINKIRPIEDKEEIINEINSYYEGEIAKEELRIKSVKRENYEDEIVNKYNELKQEIINTAKNMIDCKEVDFEDKLKGLCQKKKQLFEIKCEEMNDARKFNGAIKYEMKRLENARLSIVNNLDRSMDELKRKLEI